MGSGAPANWCKNLIPPWNSIRPSQLFQQRLITYHARFENPHDEEAVWSFIQQQRLRRTTEVHALLGTSDRTLNRVIPARGRIGHENHIRSPSPTSDLITCSIPSTVFGRLGRDGALRGVLLEPPVNPSKLEGPLSAIGAPRSWRYPCVSSPMPPPPGYAPRRVLTRT